MLYALAWRGDNVMLYVQFRLGLFMENLDSDWI